METPEKVTRPTTTVAANTNHIFLTEEGLRIAARMYERHELLTNMLTMLGVSHETALHDACKIEHDLSEETFEAIRRHMQMYAAQLGSTDNATKE